MSYGGIMMKFWDAVAVIGSALLKQLSEHQENISEYEKRYKDLDQDQLLQKYRSTVGDAKIVSTILLKKARKSTGKK